MIVNANQVRAENILDYAKDLKLEMKGFRGCLESDRFRAEVEKDLSEGRSAGVSSTPSFVIGRLANGELQGVRIVGAPCPI